MDILFISDIKDYAIGGFEPLGIEYLSACLNRANHRVHICDLDLDDAEATIEKYRVPLVAYSITTGRHHTFLEFNRKLKDRGNFLSIFGGPHPTFVPEFIREEGVDITCIGEGERALVELLNRFEKGHDYSQIPSLQIKRNGKVVTNPVQPGVRSLEEFPFPDRALLYQKFPRLAQHTMKTVLAGRGCVFKCAYCYHRKFVEKHKISGAVRMRPVDHLMNELVELKEKYPVQFFRFVDASLGFHKAWVAEFSTKYRERVDIPFSCALHPLQGSEEVIRLLKDAGCWSINWSVETGDERLRKEVLNRPVPDDKLYEMARLIRKYGMTSWIQNMVGLPSGSLEADLKTLDMNIALKPAYATCSILTPYPGTSIHKIVRDMGLMENNDTRQFEGAYFHHSVMNIPHRNEIANLAQLFSLVVDHPWLRPLVPTLIRLPLRPLYNLARKTHKGWCMLTRILPTKPSPTRIIRTAWQLLTGPAG